MAEPAVSVIIAVHNGEAFIERCIASVSAQTFADFEVIVCDDGSRDATAGLLTTIAKTEPRLKLLRNEANQGLARSLNRCIDAAAAPLIARLDADDVAIPTRLESQHAAFDSDSLVLLGSNVMYVDPGGRPLYPSDLPSDDATIRAQSFFRNPFAHPTVMMRRDVLDQENLRYDPQFQTTQDWDLWIKLMQLGKVGNLADVLVHQTVHQQSISKTRRTVQVKNSIRLQTKQAEGMSCRSLSERQYELLNTGFLDGREQADRAGVDRVAACHTALDLRDRIGQGRPELMTRPFQRWLLERCVSVGLGPPFRKGIAGLCLRLFWRQPIRFVSTVSRLRVELVRSGRKSF